jgi:putative sterol carrier protein
MAEAIDAKMFFEVGVPAALQANKETAKSVSGKTIVFDILGKGGGKWVVDFAKLESKAGSVEKPDLYVEINVQDFGDLMTGKLGGDAAATGGRLRTNGNAQLLRILGSMLAGAKP